MILVLKQKSRKALKISLQKKQSKKNKNCNLHSNRIDNLSFFLTHNEF